MKKLKNQIIALVQTKLTSKFNFNLEGFDFIQDNLTAGEVGLFVKPLSFIEI